MNVSKNYAAPLVVPPNEKIVVVLHRHSITGPVVDAFPVGSDVATVRISRVTVDTNHAVTPPPDSSDVRMRMLEKRVEDLELTVKNLKRRASPVGGKR